MDALESTKIKKISILIDLIIINGSFFFFSYLEFNKGIKYKDYLAFMVLFVSFNVVWFLLIMKQRIHERGKGIGKILIHVSKSFVLHFLITMAFVFLFKLSYFSRINLVLTYIIFFALMIGWKFIFFYFLRLIRMAGFNYRKVVIVGDGKVADDVHSYFTTHLSSGFKFIGYFSDHNEEVKYPGLLLGNTDELQAYCSHERIDEIYCTLPLTESKKISEILTFADNHMIRFKLIPDFGGFTNKKVCIDFYENMPVLSMRNEPLGEIINRIVKRAFDILFSSFVIVFIFPFLFPILALLIKISSRGPVFFKQLRTGKNNMEFICYKFRSMNMNKNADLAQAFKGDARITKVGEFLRKTNLDEIPQFFNVFLGHMSVVGPRPHMLKHTAEYSL
ncbi:MAG TPA: exopolysaccharide biosynthesis polyprenyl glycosylphosphotransferase, partial [Cytophagaceae bacterium]|nr:exopolysaccharide biosynthesis polyprenyl glycosylphosphotransferase [Cytophagaceae bacterium]